MLWLLGIDYDSIWAAMLVSQKAVPTTEILELEDCEEHLQFDKKYIGNRISDCALLKLDKIQTNICNCVFPVATCRCIMWRWTRRRRRVSCRRPWSWGSAGRLWTYTSPSLTCSWCNPSNTSREEPLSCAPQCTLQGFILSDVCRHPRALFVVGVSSSLSSEIQRFLFWFLRVGKLIFQLSISRKHLAVKLIDDWFHHPQLIYVDYAVLLPSWLTLSLGCLISIILLIFFVLDIVMLHIITFEDLAWVRQSRC